MRVGLVLGAGGVVGASWLMGTLEALAAETGWDPSEAELIVGTSAGSVVGAMVADGIDPALMGAYAAGRSLDAYAEAEQRAGAFGERVEDMEYRLERRLPPIGIGSWRLAAATITKPHRHPPAHLLAACLPRGFVSTQPVQDLVRRFVRGDWPAHAGFRAVATDFASGRRTVFGDPSAPAAHVAEAVAASCSIPGFYCPVTIGGRRYVDGGICSASNLDVVRGAGLDLVVCLNPMSSLAGALSLSPAERVAAVMRAGAGKRLGHEARKLREEGTDVLLLQPSVDDLRAMGPNLMAGGRRTAVMESAGRSASRELRRARDEGHRLPGRRRRRPRATAPAALRRAA
jgi:NTE family protein